MQKPDRMTGGVFYLLTTSPHASLALRCPSTGTTTDEYTQCELTDLAPGTDYTITATATDSTGIAAPAPSSKAFTTAPG